MYAILSRQYNPHFHDAWSRNFHAALQRNRIELLKSVYLACQTSPDELDDAKYTLQKKISEVGDTFH